jgi:tRNA threonylcarbamoyladenosine biosynthesis protein TsaB
MTVSISATSLPTFALDTSTASPSLALVRGDRTVAELWLAPEPGSGRRVLEAAHGLLRAAGTDAGGIEGIVVGVGPGGFTGLRIGLATALGLGQALAVPVTGASSLEALALGLAEGRPDGTLVAPVLDARRRELFAAAYRTRAGSLEEVIAPVAIAPDALAGALRALGGPVVAGGEGLAAAGDALRGDPFTSPPEGSARHRVTAAALVARVRAGAGLPARPVYARLPDAEVNRRAALASAGG